LLKQAAYFLNYSFGYAPDQRAELVKEPIQEPAEVTHNLHQWAAFCAASVKYLCERYSIPGMGPSMHMPLAIFGRISSSAEHLLTFPLYEDTIRSSLSKEEPRQLFRSPSRDIAGRQI
jgi:hypothetical protein